MLTFILNWLRGFAYVVDGLIIIFSLGFIEPSFSIRMDAWFLSRVEKDVKEGK